MGSRANYVIIKEVGYSLYYSHWGAQTIDTDFFWGPEVATRFVESQETSNQDEGWLDDVWAEGAGLIDPFKKVLILFGGEDIMWELPLRRVYLSLLKTIWQGWDVRWAHRGLMDLALYVGVDPSKVSTRDNKPVDFNRNPFKPGGWKPGKDVNTICSVQWSTDPPILYPMVWPCGSLIKFGPFLVECLQKETGQNAFTIDADTRGGIHLDMQRQNLTFWDVNDWSDALGAAAPWWPGWTLEWLADSVETHLELTGGRLTFRWPEPHILISRLREILLPIGKDPVKGFLSTVESIKKTENDVKINPAALTHTPLDFGPEARRHIFEQVAEEWLKNKRNRQI